MSSRDAPVGAFRRSRVFGGRLDQLEAWALALDWKQHVKLADFGLRRGLIKGERVNEVFASSSSSASSRSCPYNSRRSRRPAFRQEIWLREGRYRSRCAFDSRAGPVSSGFRTTIAT